MPTDARTAHALFHDIDRDSRGQLFKAGLIHCFNLCISMHPFLLKLEKRKLWSIQTVFMKKYFQF